MAVVVVGFRLEPLHSSDGSACSWQYSGESCLACFLAVVPPLEPEPDFAPGLLVVVFAVPAAAAVAAASAAVEQGNFDCSRRHFVDSFAVESVSFVVECAIAQESCSDYC